MSFAEVDADPARGVRGKPTNVRYLVLAGMTASVVIAYLTRSALAPAGSLIQVELQLSNTAMGQVLGVWALGYVCFQLPGGWVGDRLGRRVTLPIYAMGWSVCTLATATATSYAGMWWSRLIFGMAQGGLIPCLTRSCIDWFPAEHRGTASAWINAGMSAGAVAATALAAAMLPALGWRLTLQLFALAGIAWAAGFWITFRDRPEQHPKVNSAELALIRGEADYFDPINTKPCPSLSEQSPARSEPGVADWADHLGVYGSPAFVLLNTQAFCRAFGYAFLISWFPLYLTRGHGIHLAGASVMTTLPLAAYATGAMVGGGGCRSFAKAHREQVVESQCGRGHVVKSGWPGSALGRLRDAACRSPGDTSVRRPRGGTGGAGHMGGNHGPRRQIVYLSDGGAQYVRKCGGFPLPRRCRQDPRCLSRALGPCALDVCGGLHHRWHLLAANQYG